VLVNGEPEKLIYHQRDLQQGDPLSPMFFIIVMDVLNSLILKDSEQGLLQPILRQGVGQRVSLYVDDVMLFLQPRMEEFLLIKEILQVFGATSGLVTNVRKCSVTPIQCKEEDMTVVQDAMPCNVVEFPCKHLGYCCHCESYQRMNSLHSLTRLLITYRVGRQL
jgi:hypothetical protein